MKLQCENTCQSRGERFDGMMRMANKGVVNGGAKQTFQRCKAKCHEYDSIVQVCFWKVSLKCSLLRVSLITLLQLSFHSPDFFLSLTLNEKALKPAKKMNPSK